MKTTSGWYDGGNGTDIFGFSGLPGGYRYLNTGFYIIGDYGLWWASTENSNYYGAWDRYVGYLDPEVYLNSNDEEIGFSVRCVQD